MTYRIEIPRYHPTRLNQLLGAGNYHVRARLKRRDRETIGLYVHLNRVPPATGKRRVKLTITLAPKQRGADPDAYQKSLADALVKAKVLIDDNRQGVEFMPVRYERGPEPATVIELEDIEPESRSERPVPKAAKPKPKGAKP